MSATPTEEFIAKLPALKAGDLGRLRNHAGLTLAESVEAFDLFTGLWWPLRQKNQRAPRREVAWLICKLFAGCPVQHKPGVALASQLGRLRFDDAKTGNRHREQFDALLQLSLGQLEPALARALTELNDRERPVDWVRLTNDLSVWERERTRLKWAAEFLGAQT